MKTRKELAFCSSQKTTSGGRFTDSFFRYNPPVYLRFPINVEKAILRYFSREVIELILFILELKRIWKTRSKDLEKLRTRLEDRRMFAPSMLSF